MLISIVVFFLLVVAIQPGFVLPWKLSSRLLPRANLYRPRSVHRLHSHTAELPLSAGLKQVQLLFDCSEIDPDVASELLLELGALSVSVEVASEREMLADQSSWRDVGRVASWASAVLRATLPAATDTEPLRTHVQAAFPHQRLQFVESAVEDRDWVAHVQQLWRPRVIGNLTVLLPWHSDDVQTRHSLRLDGGAAFGTGDHPTTRLCCAWLDETIREGAARGESPSVLDYGCGSGMLGLAALKFGALEADGTDVDLNSLICARRNAVQNQLSMGLYLVHDIDAEHAAASETTAAAMPLNALCAGENDFRGVESICDKRYDLVVANILAPVLIDLAPSLAAHCKAGGKIALSGILQPQAARVIAEYQKYFDRVQIESNEDDWVLIVATNRVN